jgi:anaerobic ribonucleoside-triphosphate reductase activating protein
MKINLGGIIPLSANEWQDHVSIVIFFNGCPFKCNYCHNHQMISAQNYVDIQEVKNAIKNSIPFINSVVFSGGEPTEQPDPLENLLSYSKSLGLNTMIETNGYHPEVLKDLCEKNLVDMLFVDIKTTAEDYDKFTGAPNSYEKMIETLRIAVPHTKRTTVFKNIKIPRCSLIYQKGLVRLSPDKTVEEYTEEEFERLIHKSG